MKHKIILTAFLLLAASVICGADSLKPGKLHEYGFILSCGITVYQTFDHELTDAELLEWTDFYENTKCTTIQDGNDNPKKP